MLSCRRFVPVAAAFVGALAAAVRPGSAQPLTTAFTYQGELNNAGTPAVGLHDLRFRLFDAAAGGAQAGATLCADNVSVTGGRFTVALDFGAQFAGQQRFLQIDVRADTGLGCGNPAGFVILSPRQPLTAVPHAAFALNTSQLNGQGGSFYQNAANLTGGTIPSARLSGVYSGPLTFSNAGNAFTGSGAGLAGVNADLLDGLNSTAFLQSIPVPLTLNGSTGNWIIKAENTAVSGNNFGVLGQSASTAGIGVFGHTSAATGETYGVYGQTASSSNNTVGVYGTATAATGETYGVYGRTESTAGRAVFGLSSALTGPADGVYGISNSSTGRGAVGWATAPSGTTYGVFGLTQSASGRGVYGLASSSTGSNYGVFGSTLSTNGYAGYFTGPAGSVNYFERNVGIGTTSPLDAKLHVISEPGSGAFYGVWAQTYSPSGRGVVGTAFSTSGTTFGVWGLSVSINPNAYGVYSTGDLGATGVKTFRIDHPGDPANKYLLHYAAESPEVINFYSGKAALDAAGEAVVELPLYFARINKDPRYTLTAIGAPMPMLHIAEEIDEDALAQGAKAEPGDAAPTCSFRIAGGASGARVSWEVKAVRNDRWVQQRGAPVEMEKEGPEKGTYQHPELYGQPPEKGMNYDATRERAAR